MMFAPRIIYSLLPLLAIAASAQSAKDAVEPIKAEAREPARDADVQQRRAMLRASLRSQPEVALVREAPVNSVRLLSAQERADLRQQLRQQ
nr:hypothetical protein [Rhodoferax sp.]